MLEKRKVTKFQTGHQTTQKLLKTKNITAMPACMQCAYCYAQFCPYPYI